MSTEWVRIPIPRLKLGEFLAGDTTDGADDTTHKVDASGFTIDRVTEHADTVAQTADAATALVLATTWTRERS